MRVSTAIALEEMMSAADSADDQELTDEIIGLFSVISRIAFAGDAKKNIEILTREVLKAIARWGAERLANALASVILTELEMIRLATPEVNLDALIDAGLDLADSWAQRDNPARPFLGAIRANPHRSAPRRLDDPYEDLLLVIGLLLVFAATRVHRNATESAGDFEEDTEYSWELAGLLATADSLRVLDPETEEGRKQAQVTITELWNLTATLIERWSSDRIARSLITVIHANIAQALAREPERETSSIVQTSLALVEMTAGAGEEVRAWLEEALADPYTLPAVPHQGESSFLLIIGLVLMAVYTHLEAGGALPGTGTDSRGR